MPPTTGWEKAEALTAVILLIIGAVVAAAYFDFNPALPIFAILGFGIYLVGRNGQQMPKQPTPPLQYLRRLLDHQDFLPPTRAYAEEAVRISNSGEGVDPADPKKTGQ
jgi:hypothetical protein